MAYHGLSTSPSSKASFGSYRSQGTATDLLADVSMTQARQTGQDVLSAVTATVPEPFGPQLSTAKARKSLGQLSWTRHTCNNNFMYIQNSFVCIIRYTHTRIYIYILCIYTYICDYMCTYTYNT